MARHDHSRQAISLCREGKADALMKGNLHTDELLVAAISREGGLRGDFRASHAFVMDVPSVDRPLILTDCVVNIEPGLMDKRDIAQNAIYLAQAIGIETPRLAILSAIENINPAITSTLDAAALCKMTDRGQITGAVVDGPLGYDNAISKVAAINKGIVSAVSGRPDILSLPNLEAGNMLYKQLIYMTSAECAGLVLGMKVPIILTGEVITAYKQIYPAAKEACKTCIPQLPLTFSEGDLHKVFNRHGKKAAGFDDYGKFKDMFTEMGIVGIVIGETERYVVGRFEYTMPHKLVTSSNDRLCLHPVFAEVFRFKRSATGAKAIYPYGSDPDGIDYREF